MGEKWEMVRLGDVAVFQTGGTPTRMNAGYFCGTNPWITTTALGQTYIDASNSNAFITDEAVKNSSTKTIPENSLMVGIRVGVGKVSINSIPMCTNQDIVSISKIDTSIISLEYLHKYITTQQRYFDSQKRGATIQGIRTELLRDLIIPLPPLPIQQKIADALDCASTLIEKRKAQIEKLDLLIKAQFIAMFGDPVTNPMGWEVACLSEISDRIGDGLHGTPIYSMDGEIPFVNGNNFKNGRITIFRDTKKVHIDEYRKYSISISKNAILISINGSLGNIALYHGEKVVLSKSACYINLVPSVDRNFLYHLMKTDGFKKFLDDNSTISTIQNISLKTIRECIVINPPADMQHAFSSCTDQIEAQKSLLQSSLAQLQQNYNALKQKCFRGELF